ncbi:YbaB/EbfC family nucleoid-associated protein [Patescibacteria group bacterium]|nr:YbaB/EbfC family nucleoid-associated protein [Patescibacteria group bacterium]MBU0964233.1 YbaB/EbfC family nucleoid-associated protein [Patescibacteria group bacterium]
MFNKIKQIKDMRNQASQIKQTLAEESVHAESAGGRVNIVMDGNMETLSIEINPELLTSEKKEELENAIKEAVNSAIKKAQRAMAMKIQGMGGLNMPGL